MFESFTVRWAQGSDPSFSGRPGPAPLGIVPAYERDGPEALVLSADLSHSVPFVRQAELRRLDECRGSARAIGQNLRRRFLRAGARAQVDTGKAGGVPIAGRQRGLFRASGVTATEAEEQPVGFLLVKARCRGSCACSITWYCRNTRLGLRCGRVGLHTSDNDLLVQLNWSALPELAWSAPLHRRLLA